MSGLTFDDPEVADFSAASGSLTFHPVGTANLVVHASENSSTTYFQPSAALDHDNNTAWETNSLGAGATSLTVRKPDSSAITVVSYTLACRNGWQGRAPSVFTLYGSNDATSWTSVDSRTGQTDWYSPNNVKNFVLSTPATFVYWKLVVTATAGGDILNLGEMYFNDVENTVPPSSPSYFIKVTGIPRGRIVTPVVSGDIEAGDWQYRWRACVTEYAFSENEYTGSSYNNPYSPGVPSGSNMFYGLGRDMILVVGLETGSGPFTVDWTSTVAPTLPQGVWWYDRQVLNPAGGTLAYDAVQWAPGNGSDRYYSLTVATSDPLTISTNEPDCYYEVYAETGVRAWDEYIEDGWNDPVTGVPMPGDGTLQITPIPGQEYVIVVYPNAVPDEATEYTLSWSQESFVAPYVVSNDMLINALNLGLATTGLTHSYDNTGATPDPEVSWAKRSIWYSFHVDAASFIKVTATPSSADAAKSPDLYFFYSDGLSTGTYFASGSPTAITYTPVPAGAEVHLMIAFGDATPTSDWEQSGSMTFDVRAAPAHTTETYTLPPGDITPGGGQNYHVGPAFPGSSIGSFGTMRIVAPRTGGLSMIVEAGNEGGTTYRPSVDITLPYRVQVGRLTPENYWDSDPLILKTDIDPQQGPRWLPWRAVGATTPDPITIRVKAGDVINIKVWSAVSGCYVRWGMATKGDTSDWFSARYGDVITLDGTTRPEVGWTPDALWVDVRANASAWPSPYELHLGTEPGDTRTPVVSYGGNYVGNNGRNADGGGIVTNLMYPALQDDINGLNGGRTTDTSYGDIVRNDINISAMHDPGQNSTRQEVDTGLRIVRHQGYVLGNDITQVKENGPDIWHDKVGDELAYALFRDANMPVAYRASNGQLNAFRRMDNPPYNYWDADYEMLQWAIEWEGQDTDAPTPVYNLYQWVNAIGLTRYVRAPYDPLDGYNGTPIITPDPLNLRLYNIPVELTDQPWVMPEEIESAGQVIYERDVPAEPLTGKVNAPTIQPNISTSITDSHDSYFSGPIAYDRDLKVANVFGRQPVAGDMGFDVTYAMLIAPYRQRSLDIDGILATAWIDHGMAAPHYFTHSMGGGLQCEMQVRTRLGRLYPPRFRVAKWVPSLAAIVTETPGPTTPGAGYFILPNPNLDGEGDGVDVHFASAT